MADSGYGQVKTVYLCMFLGFSLIKVSVIDVDIVAHVVV